MLALYRKYRPRSFADLVGQEQLAAMLRTAGRTGKLAHAYVFYGSRGTGKTTVARIIAKLANCLSPESVKERGEPCNACRACDEIDAGRAMDVIEIDAASNRGIDEIRDLREAIRLAPSSLLWKIFIVDEAHMLTTPAWNALLKTLEEPPERAMIILATTEFEKIPPTIASRAQRYRFNRIPLAEIVRTLRRIADIEKIAIADDALDLIAAAAEGSLRDAESLLDQVASLGAGADAASVEMMLGKTGFRRIRVFADGVAGRDLPSLLAELGRARDEGANLLDICRELILHLRRALALHFDPKLGDAIRNEVTGEEFEAVSSHASSIDIPGTIALMKSLIRAHQEMRYSPFPHVPLEVALIECLGGK